MKSVLIPAFAAGQPRLGPGSRPDRLCRRQRHQRMGPGPAIEEGFEAICDCDLQFVTGDVLPAS